MTARSEQIGHHFRVAVIPPGSMPSAEIASYKPTPGTYPHDAQLDFRSPTARAIGDLLVGERGKFLVGQQHRMDVLGNDQARRGLISELWIERPAGGLEEAHRLV